MLNEFNVNIFRIKFVDVLNSLLVENDLSISLGINIFSDPPFPLKISQSAVRQLT